MQRVAVMTDSSADIHADQAEQLGLYVMRFPLIIDGQEYIEEEQISTPEFIRRMKEGAVVKTSQAHLGELIDTWNRILEEADEILYLPISSGLSGSYQSACTAAAGFDGRVTVVDARFACYPLTWLCLWAKRQLEEGYSCAQFKDKM